MPSYFVLTKYAGGLDYTMSTSIKNGFKTGGVGILKEKRWLGLWLAGFMLGRVWFLSINPFAVAFFAVLCQMKKGYKGTAFAILAGMLSSQDGIPILKYMLLYMLVIGIEYIREKRAEI